MRWRKYHPRPAKTNCHEFKPEMPVKAVEAMAAAKKATPAQIAPAWLLAQKPWIAPIPGTKKLSRLEENCGAVKVHLSAADMESIAAELAKIPLHGERYSPANQKNIDR